jgi:hypothetical protein
MSDAMTKPDSANRSALRSAAHETMERLNAEVAGLHIWLRTEANSELGMVVQLCNRGSKECTGC